MNPRLILALTALALPACGGGGGTTPLALATSAPSASPTQSATGSPSAAPSPSSAPTTAPTQVPLHLAAAPAQVFTAQGLVRRSAQDARRIASTNLGNGQIPAVIGATSPYYGTILTQLYAWAATAQSTPVPEVSLTAVPANVVSGPVSIVSIGQDNGNLFASTYFDWVVQLGINKVGQGNIIATFHDGTTGQIPVYIYDEWYLTCQSVVDVNHPMEWAYTAGVPKGVFGATSDMTVDCSGLTLTFTNGGIQQAAPVADAWGNVASALTTVVAGTTAAGPLSISIASLKLGTIYIVKLADGGFAKIMPLVSDGAPNAPNISGLSLHDNPSGSGQFSF